MKQFDEDWVPTVLDGWRRGQHLSAVGPGPLDEHLDHARRMADLIGRGPSRGLDLGSGAGIPGLALAGLRPEMRWTLLDAALRRTRLLQAVVDELGWGDRVDVVHARAEDAARLEDHRRGYDIVTARRVAPPPVTAELAAPFLGAGGRLLVSEPPDDDGVERWSSAGLRPLGLCLGVRHHDPAVQVLEVCGPLEARFPRKAGVAAKRPLW